MLTEAENHARDLRLNLDGTQDEARVSERGSRAA
jgi:hypothetical protein